MPKTNNSGSSVNNKGKLYLLPATLGDDSDPAEVLPLHTLNIIKKLEVFIVEELKTARRFLKQVDKNIIIDTLQILIYNEHSIKENTASYIEPMLEGKDTGLLSEAGMPCIADPGADIVAAAHRQCIEVVPLSGPSSLLLALIASGFSGQNFTFHGYLPIEKDRRAKKIRQLEILSQQYKQTQIFIETPYRNHQMIQSIIENCREETMLCVASDLTLPSQKIISQSVKSWKKMTPDLHKRPAVFLLFTP
ncbi:MAG TPA: SAM-dependent methyltransferase [Bacteroidales bacterium]|nr:SAM-dependent methyltransferase [Bacteroidales bacterium]